VVGLHVEIASRQDGCEQRAKHKKTDHRLTFLVNTSDMTQEEAYGVEHDLDMPGNGAEGRWIVMCVVIPLEALLDLLNEDICVRREAIYGEDSIVRPAFVKCISVQFTCFSM
jgi:hypothetical protein